MGYWLTLIFECHYQYKVNPIFCDIIFKFYYAFILNINIRNDRLI